MAGFNASKAVDKMEWDFRPYVDAKGVIPEPTDEQLARFQKEQARLGAQALEDSELSAEEYLKKQAEIDEEVLLKNVRETAELFAAICSNTPSVEEIMKLPMRQRSAFYGWVRESLTPKA
jgi:hypothetical protein